MNPKDAQLCRNAVRNLTQGKYAANNHLFLDPFDLKEVPGYMEKVEKVMDLSTLSNNLEEGHYSNRNDFFHDANRIFTNAIAYHQTQEDSNWIVEMATVMLKISKEEKTKAALAWKKTGLAGKKKKTGLAGKKKKTGLAAKKKTSSPGKKVVKTILPVKQVKKVKKKSAPRPILPFHGNLETWKTFGGYAVPKGLPVKKVKKKSAPLRPILPIHGNLETWKTFGDNGGYAISKPKWLRLRLWVLEQHKNQDVIADRVAFHRLIVKMKAQLRLKSPRDRWSEVLPKFTQDNFFFATLMLMISTPQVPDTKIIEVFGELFQDNEVTEEWVLDVGEQKLAKILEPLGMQYKSAKYIMKAAEHMLNSPPPRDYRDLMNLDGVGPKVALVTLQEAHGRAQGIPCDIHMCRMYTILNWIPSFDELGSCCCDMLEENNEEHYDYELARAAMEGWFPPFFWKELNQTWAGLGQLLNEEVSRKAICEFVDAATSDCNTPWRQADKTSFRKLLKKYLRR
jgi:endonuclease III